MKAARLYEFGQPMVVEEIPDLSPNPGEVIVKIAGCGFCHSDVHFIGGELPIAPAMPITLGHENAGYVAKIGEGVSQYKEGDPVVVFGGWGCRTCDICSSSTEQLCADAHWVGLSDGADGGYAEYLRVPTEQYLIPLKDNLDPKVAAAYTDAALTPYRAIRKALPLLTPGSKVLAIGMGALGQYGIKLLKLMTACEIIAVDISDDKLAIAKRYGADYLINSADPDIMEQILNLTHGAGVSGAFDFVGLDSTLALAIASTASLGKVSQVGLGGGSANFKVMENSRFEVSYEAILWGTVKELRDVMAMAENGQLTPIALEYAPLEHINEVYQRVKTGQVEGRIIITP